VRVVVIGAGIVGASTAYHLASRGSGVDVVLLDRADPGRATDAGAGIICPWISTAPRRTETYDLHVAGATYYPDLVERLAEDADDRSRVDTSYAAVGGLFVSTDEAQLASVHDVIAGRAADDPRVGSVSKVGPVDVRRMFPPLHPDLSGVHVSGGGRVDGRAIRDALLAAAERHGVRQMQESAVLTLDGGGVTGVRIDSGSAAGTRIGADAVVVAAGAWTAALLRPTGVNLALAPQKGQIVHVELAAADTASWPIVQPPGAHYLLAFPGGRIVCGATRETGSGYDVRVTASGLRQVLADALAVAPGLDDATLLETRVGLRPLSDDGMPLLGTVPGVEGLVAATGLGATGLTAGPYAGDLAAHLALGELPPFDVGAFRLDRT
jgi:D-amino-acid dehydrogenase